MESLVMNEECIKELEVLHFKCVVCNTKCAAGKEVIKLYESCEYHKKVEEEWHD